MDALTLVRQDHRKLEGLLERLGQATGDEVQERAVLIGQLKAALGQHVDQEEGFLYPIFRERARRAEVDLATLDRGVEQHRLIVRLAGEAAGLGPDDALAAKLRVLTEQVRNHLDTEDSVLLTAIEDLIDDDTLLELGRRMEQRQRVVAAQRELAATMTPGNPRTRRLVAAVGGVLAAGA
ncbi:MAG TPA: hemerythrin domain-containing protein, partial [Actinomycetes bacterium]|nr:hemerythrin domain-containing protein [Actinomycetes bacterium]